MRISVLVWGFYYCEAIMDVVVPSARDRRTSKIFVLQLMLQAFLTRLSLMGIIMKSNGKRACSTLSQKIQICS